MWTTPTVSALANKTNHFSGRGPTTCDAGWQSGLVTDDHDPVVVDADFGNCRSEIGLPGVHACCFDLLPLKATHRYNRAYPVDAYTYYM